MATRIKEKKVEDFTEILKNAKITFVAEYQGLTVAEVSGLRRELRDNNSEMKVMKNTLAKRSLEEVGYNELIEKMKGPLAFIIGYDTVVEAPKVAVDFAKKNENLKIKTGYYAGKIIGIDVIKELAELPPMEQLRVKFAMAIGTPPKKFLNMISSPLHQLVRTLDAVANKKEESES